MASLDSVKAKIISGMMYVVQNSKENCLLKGVLSGVMGIRSYCFDYDRSRYGC